MAEEKTRTSGKIEIGDLVQLKYSFTIISFDDTSLKVKIDNEPNFDWLVIPRHISALGQFLPGHNWRIPLGHYILSDQFHYTGRYSIQNELYLAEECSIDEMDEGLRGYVAEKLEGGIIIGRVVFIYAVYINSTNPRDDDFEFFEDSEQALHDHYATEVFCIIQDLASDVEYSVNLKLLKLV